MVAPARGAWTGANPDYDDTLRSHFRRRERGGFPRQPLRFHRPGWDTDPNSSLLKINAVGRGVAAFTPASGLFGQYPVLLKDCSGGRYLGVWTHYGQ